MNFKQIKENYDKGLWTKPMVKICVTKGLINPKEYQQITGEVYQAL